MTGRIRKIPLTQGQFAIVDPEDFEYLSQWNWHAMWQRSIGSYYAARSKRVEGKSTKITMHRIIVGLSPEDSQQVDHENHNTLDNRRKNLRIVTNRENSENRKDQSEFGIGVKIHADCVSKPYEARTYIGGKYKYIGMFATPEEAQAARKQFLKEN